MSESNHIERTMRMLRVSDLDRELRRLVGYLNLDGLCVMPFYSHHDQNYFRDYGEQSVDIVKENPSGQSRDDFCLSLGITPSWKRDKAWNFHGHWTDIRRGFRYEHCGSAPDFASSDWILTMSGYKPFLDALRTGVHIDARAYMYYWYNMLPGHIERRQTELDNVAFQESVRW